PFEYEKDDKRSHYSDEELQNKVFSLFYDPFQEQKYRNLNTMPRSTAVERGIYNMKSIELKTELSQYQNYLKTSIKTLMEDKEVDKGGLISGGLNTRQRMELVYKHLRELKQRHEYQDRLFGTTNWFYKQTGAEIPDIDQRKLIKMDLGIRDERVLRHFREQVFDSPEFGPEFITKKTNELNKKRINIINEQYNLKVKLSQVLPKNLLRNQLIRIGKERVQAIKNATLTEYEVDSGYMNKNRTRLGNGLDISEPSWVNYYKKNKKKFLEDDFTAIRKSQIQWATGKQQIKNLYDDIVKQKQRRAELKKNPVNPYTDQNNEWDNQQYSGWISNTDIQRKPRHHPPEPDKPVIPTPKPDDPKPKPLPPHRKTGRRRLLGETNLEPQYDLPYDGDIKFDIEIAKHLLHICEHSYERFDDSYFPSNDIFEYDVTGKFGDENFGTSEQARGYYSNEKNVLTIAFRGTDFGKIYTGRFDLFVADLIKDLSISPVYYDGLRVHSGFLQFYLSLKEQINEFFTNTRVDADTMIYTTGHSYGAIPAMILAYEINKFFKYKKCVCYTFGSPRGFDRESARIVNSQLTSFRVADINDPITLLPPKAVAGQNYYHAGRTILLDGEILKEIKDNDEADTLFTISTVSTLKFGAQLGVENVLISLLTGLETPSQITLAQRLSGYFQQFVNPTNFPAMLENVKNFGAGLMRYMGFTQPTSRYGLRNTPERIRRQQIPNFIVSRRNNLFTEFFTKFPKAKSAFYTYDIAGEDVLEIIKNEGLGESHMWEDGLVRKLIKKGVPREATKSFLTTLEQLYFPEKLENYKSWLDSYGVG
ncbi:MAG: lipase family protein, partial [Promethearchaeota archaeon]